MAHTPVSPFSLLSHTSCYLCNSDVVFRDHLVVNVFKNVFWAHWVKVPDAKLGGLRSMGSAQWKDRLAHCMHAGACILGRSHMHALPTHTHKINE